MVGLFMGHRLSVAPLRQTAHAVRTPLRHGVQIRGAHMFADISAACREVLALVERAWPTHVPQGIPGHPPGNQHMTLRVTLNSVAFALTLP